VSFKTLTWTQLAPIDRTGKTPEQIVEEARQAIAAIVEV
jgi:predicted RNase H-like HicB family nuclease